MCLSYSVTYLLTYLRTNLDIKLMRDKPREWSQIKGKVLNCKTTPDPAKTIVILVIVQS